MNRLEAEKYVEKRFLVYFFVCAISVWVLTQFIGLGIANYVLPQQRYTVLVITGAAAQLLSWVVPLNWNWYWRKTLEEAQKK